MTGPEIAQLDVRAVDDGELAALLDAVADADAGTGGDWSPPSHGHGDVWWLLAEQSDGYTVARHDAGRWRTARTVTDRVVPFDPRRIAELRVFRASAELLAHPVGDGRLRARWRIRTDDPVPTPLLPRDDRAVQLTRSNGARHDGFTTLHRPDGSSTVVPFDDDRPALSVREHFCTDARTGAVRVAVTCLDHYAPSAFKEGARA